MFDQKNNILLLLIMGIAALYVFSSKKENWGGTSPGTMIQLSSNSGYYPFNSYGFGYQYPQYMFKYPYRLYYPMGYIPHRYRLTY